MSRFLPGDLAPPFCSQAVKDGEIVELTLDDALRGYQYLLLVFYPAHFTFACPSEVTQFTEKWSEFSAEKCRVVCCSTDSAYTHLAWLKASKSERGLGSPDNGGSIILLSDRSREISECYGVLAEMSPAVHRATFLISADKRICQVSISDMAVGRSVEEALRLVKEMRSGGGSGGDIGSGSGSGSGASTDIGGGMQKPPRGPKLGSSTRTRMSELQAPLCGQIPPQFLNSQQHQPPPCPYQYQQQQHQQQHQQQQQNHQQQHQQQHQNHQQQQQQQQQYQFQQTGLFDTPVTFQCEPQTFNVGQPVCSTLAVEAASLETQAAQLRVKDSEARLNWMLAETDRLRVEADRLRMDTERLKAEAQRRQTEADRLISCHTSCQAAGLSTGGGAMTMTRDDCSWSATAAGVQGVHRAPSQPYHHAVPPSLPPAPPPLPPPPLPSQQMSHHYHQSQMCQAKPSRPTQSHMCRRGANSVSSHVAGGSQRC